LLLPRRAGSRLTGHARRLLLPGQGLLDRQLSGWPCDPLLLCGAALRPAQLGVLVADFAAGLDGQLGPAFRRGGRPLPLALFFVAPAAFFLSAVAALTA
jgi:hypothetical protein